MITMILIILGLCIFYLALPILVIGLPALVLIIALIIELIITTPLAVFRWIKEKLS